MPDPSPPSCKTSVLQLYLQKGQSRTACFVVGPLNCHGFWASGGAPPSHPNPGLAGAQDARGRPGARCARVPQPSSDPTRVQAAAPTLPWVVVQLNPRFLASRLQSKPLRCRIRAASAEGSESSCWQRGREARCWGPLQAPRHLPTAHLCLQRPQVEDVEVTGDGGSKGHEGAQGRRGWLLLGHRQDQGLGVQVHGGDVAQQGGEADRAAVLRLAKSKRSERARRLWGQAQPARACGASRSFWPLWWHPECRHPPAPGTQSLQARSLLPQHPKSSRTTRPAQLRLGSGEATSPLGPG